MFGIIGKKTAWNAWSAFPEVTDTFSAIINDPTNLTLGSLHMRRLEWWTFLMYNKSYSADTVNEARRLVFTHGLNSLDSFPPNQNVSFQHAKLTLHAASFG